VTDSWVPTDYRLEYIRHELREHGLATDPCGLLERVVTEVAYAAFSPVHEGSQTGYGAIITDHWRVHCDHIPEFYPSTSASCNENGRRLADGANGFLVWDRNAPVLWMPSFPMQSEAGLFSLRDEVLFKQPERSPHADPAGTDVVLVQRTGGGTVTVVHWDGITTLRAGHWFFKQYQYRQRVEEQLESRLGGISDVMKATVRSALRLCLHVLSPNGCGATLVLALDADGCLSARLNHENALSGVSWLSLRQRLHHRVLAHLLAQIDGAAVFGENGSLMDARIWLTPKQHANSPSLGGARQLTAQATSRDVSSPIITVSADGPVRVFHAGELIANFSTEAH